jgi:DNA-binding CsgD family transcriptional regulator
MAARAAGDLAADDDHLLWAVEAWHLAVRLGRPELVMDRLARVAGERPGSIATLYLAHAQALGSADPEALEDVVHEFEGAGFRLFAAETAAQLSGIRRRRGEPDQARRAATLARELLPEGSGARTPAFSELSDLVPLTNREREVALLAAAGLPSKDIADRLYISVRSVDNHLSRVYAKLGVSGRSDLARVFGT